MSAGARVAQIVLLVIVGGSLSSFAWRQLTDSHASIPNDPGSSAAAQNCRVLVTYFTTDVRCASCRKIEAQSRDAVQSKFASELTQGVVHFRVINTDRTENRHYIDRYDITNKIVIVSYQPEGVEREWTSRQDIWELMDDPTSFANYVQEPIALYLKRKS